MSHSIYECPLCEKLYQTSKKLSNHLVKYHNVDNINYATFLIDISAKLLQESDEVTNNSEISSLNHIDNKERKTKDESKCSKSDFCHDMSGEDFQENNDEHIEDKIHPKATNTSQKSSLYQINDVEWKTMEESKCSRSYSCHEISEKKFQEKNDKNIEDKIHPKVFNNSRDKFKDEIWKHEKIFHSDMRKYSCRFCHKKFKRGHHLKSHTYSNHGTDEKGQPVKDLKACKFCDKKFLYACKLNAHQLAHSNEILQSKTHAKSQKYFPCKFCGKYLKTKENLKRHEIDIHTETGSIPCTICSMKFKRKYSLEKHLLTVHDKRRYIDKLNICKICNKKFVYEVELLNHQRSHSDEKPFKCDRCSNKYKLKSHLKRHKFTAHSLI